MLCVTCSRAAVSRFPPGVQGRTIVEKHAVNCQRIVADLLGVRPRPGNGAPTHPPQCLPSKKWCAWWTPSSAGNAVPWNGSRPDLPPVNIDVNKMKQVYLNLLMNSRQAITDRGTIRIKTDYLKDPARCSLVFEDNGNGSRRRIGRISTPFSARKRPARAPAWGLSVSYGIIKEHGGDIQAESEPGQWTRFTIQLPAEGSR